MSQGRAEVSHLSNEFEFPPAVEQTPDSKTLQTLARELRGAVIRAGFSPSTVTVQPLGDDDDDVKLRLQFSPDGSSVRSGLIFYWDVELTTVTQSTTVDLTTFHPAWGDLRDFGPRKVCKGTVVVAEGAGERHAALSCEKLRRTLGLADSSHPDKSLASTYSSAEYIPAEDLQGDPRQWDLGDLGRGDLIIPRLFLGGHVASANKSWLDQEKISHILRVGVGLDEHFPSELEYMGIDVYDGDETHIYPFFESACAFIDKGRAAGGVFVHCAAGLSRSATIVASYLMKRWRCSVEAALEHVRSRRYVMPNDGFMLQLNRWQRWTCPSSRSTHIEEVSEIDDALTEAVANAAAWLRDTTSAEINPQEAAIDILRGGNLVAESSLQDLEHFSCLMNADPRFVGGAGADLCGSVMAEALSLPWPESDRGLRELSSAFTERLFMTRDEYESTRDWAELTAAAVNFMCALGHHAYLKNVFLEEGCDDQLRYVGELCTTLSRSQQAIDDQGVQDSISELAEATKACLDTVAFIICAVEYDHDSSIFMKQSTYDLCGVGFKVWPSARMMAKWMWEQRPLFEGKRVLELGAGPGALSLVAVNCGAKFVRCTDYLDGIIETIDHNIVMNRVSSQNMQSGLLDWNDVVNGTLLPDNPAISGSATEAGRPYDVIVAADVIYTVADTERESVVPLVKLFAETLHKMLREWWPEAIFYGAMQRTREGVEHFKMHAEELGLTVEQHKPDAGKLRDTISSDELEEKDNIWYIFTVH